MEVGVHVSELLQEVGLEGGQVRQFVSVRSQTVQLGEQESAGFVQFRVDVSEPLVNQGSLVSSGSKELACSSCDVSADSRGLIDWSFRSNQNWHLSLRVGLKNLLGFKFVESDPFDFMGNTGCFEHHGASADSWASVQSVELHLS